MLFSRLKSNKYKLILLLVLAFCTSAFGEYLADGARLIPLTSDGKSKAGAWSWHGDLISFVRKISDTQGQLMIMRSDGSSEFAVSPIGNPFFAEWSWRGDKISYEFSNSNQDQSQGGVFVYDLKTGKTISVSQPYPKQAIDPWDGPTWSEDDKYVAYKLEVGPAETDQVWIADAQSGKMWQLLPERGKADDQRWSPTDPRKIVTQVQSSGTGFDIATTDLDGRNVSMLTDIDAQSVRTDGPCWSPDGQYVAFKFDLDMTRTERERGVEDCWIAKYDGTEIRNLTKATTASTEDMLDLRTPFWTWDGNWIISTGSRFDQQGNDISTIYKIDPVNGGYEIIMTSYPRTGKVDSFRTIKGSYDGTKLAYVKKNFTVRNWGPDAEYENPLWILGIYDIDSGKEHTLLTFDEQLDRKEIQTYDRDNSIGGITWSPDNRSILFTIANIISEEDNITEPDIYRLELPESLIDASASKLTGPPTGREGTHTIKTAVPVETNDTVESEAIGSLLSQENLEDYVTEIIQPNHMTVAEAVDSISNEYADYFTINISRNIILFKGPAYILAELKNDLGLIDSLPPHILVDLLAVELSDEANRSLGLDWSYADGHFGFVQPAGRPIRNFGANPPTLGDMSIIPGLGQTFYQGVGTIPREFYMRLSTLVEDGDGTILANPRTVATSGIESLINIRKTLNYFFNEGFDVAGRPVVKKSDISSDTVGRITPTLLPDGKIHVIVDVKVGTFTFTQNAGLPELTTREAATEVTVKEGETIVVGGLRQQEIHESTTKVPILGDIPFIGFLFRHEEKTVTNSVLTIFITPRLMDQRDLNPDWPVLDPTEHKIVPIMADEPDETY